VRHTDVMQPYSRRRPWLRTLLLVPVALLVAIGTGGAWLQPGSAENPLLRPAPAPAAVSTNASVPPLPLPLLSIQTTRPVDVPDDPYADEPLVEIGTIEIPKIGLRHRLFHGITLGTIDHGPAHWPGSAYPGQLGNAVFAGHRVTHSQPFRHIDRLVPGDEVIFVVNGNRSVYRVTGHEVVTPAATWIANPTPSATATLFACHPPGSAKFRYVVRLALVRTGGA
jgi:sortase A